MRHRNAKDLPVYALLLGLGALALALCCRASDIFTASVYYDSARSIVEHGWYGSNSRPQATLPPGFSLLLAGLSVTIGSGYGVMIRAVVVITTLGFLAAYRVLRFQEGRWVSAATSLLIASSPVVFAFSTRMLFSDMPYFFTSMLFLWLAMLLDGSTKGLRTALLWTGCGVLLFSSILLRTMGIALVGGTAVWLGVHWLRNDPQIRRRARLFVPLLLVGFATQAAWSHWAEQRRVSDWPLRGYPERYLRQLELKNGNNPELGLASWKDVLVRPIEDLDGRAAALVTLLMHKDAPASFYSPVTSLPILLLLIGLARTISKSGGNLIDWYFVTYEAMYLFWPWDFEIRFFLPVAPLACVYLWRGAVQLWSWTQISPRRVGAAGLLAAGFFCTEGIRLGWPTEHTHGRWSVLLWLLIVTASIVLVTRAGTSVPRIISEHLKSHVKGSQVRNWQIWGGAVVLLLFAIGVAGQIQIGKTNLHFDPTRDDSYPDIEAADWVREHSDPNEVVMARDEDLVYHYCQRRVIWFPPSSDPQLLLAGIRRYHIHFVIVVNRSYSYWMPPEQDCFQSLKGYAGDRFTLVHSGPHNEIYAVTPEPLQSDRSKT